ncbi:MAG: hypothetical protein ACREKL_08000 [Chthoniobacterales bacterium]
MLFYVPQAITMKKLGLLYVVTDETEQTTVIEKCLKEHNPETIVRVICISGRHLFREQWMPNGKPCPLHKLATEGKLDVIMPRSHPENQTILRRHATYSELFKRANGIESVDSFITEIEAGKRFLRHYGNTVREHDILCMWRVIILSSHSIVQSYFPNKSKTESFRAPMFVYSTGAPEEHFDSYYNTHTQMFELVSLGCQP